MARVRSIILGLDAAVTGLARAAAWLAGGFLVLMIGHVLLEIVLRSVFATSTYVLDEFVGYTVAAVTFLSAAYAFQEDAFIRVSLLLSGVVRHRPLRRAFEFACVILAAAPFWFVVYHFVRSVVRHFERGRVSETISETPMWIPEGLMLAGLALLAARISVYGLRLLAGGPMVEEAVPVPADGHDATSALSMRGG